jgi:putative membrane protein
MDDDSLPDEPDQDFDDADLHFAAQDGDMTRVSTLLAEGRSPNAFDELSKTPFITQVPVVGRPLTSLSLHRDRQGTLPGGVREDLMKRTGLLGVAVGAVIIVIGCSNTEGTRTPGSAPPADRGAAVGTGGAGANLSDGEFVHDVAIKNMAEIELSRMALDKATSPEVKAFAQMMIHDHGTAGDKLQSVVSGQPIEWPAQVDDKQREVAGDLAKEQGPAFDRDYLKAMVEGHQDLAAKLESRLDVQSLAEWKTAAAGRAQSKALPEPKVEMPDVKVRPNKSDNEITTKINQWAAETYPVAQKHLDTARTLENATKKRSTN